MTLVFGTTSYLNVLAVISGSDRCLFCMQVPAAAILLYFKGVQALDEIYGNTCP